ncbi:MAG: hypothetical protein PUD22_00615 [Erysipelotrichaceae bacterium]|nr:hypothetical protein [Erysipelotrichaceae bacterium]
MYNTEKFDNFEPKRFTSDGVINIKGTDIPYHTVSEDNVFYDNEGKAIASIFSYSYFRSDIEDVTRRPVMFCYNGGPGSSSMYVHAGFFGVKRIKYEDNVDRKTSLPPYETIDNPDSLLDICDIVVIDPVGTGFGLLLDEKRGKDFYGIEEDAESILTFIEKWCRRYGRFASPKYLCGESYGCTRSAVAAGIAGGGFGNLRGYGIKFDGIVMIGNTVTVGKYFGMSIPVEDSVIFFPTFAAINWYHNHPSEQSVDEFAYEAKKFADTEYLLALYQGESLQGEKREEIKKKISYYTGVSAEFLEERDLRIDENGFRSEVIKDKGLAVSRYDGRMTRPLLKPAKTEEAKGPYSDATAQRYDGMFYSVTCGIIHPLLNIKLDRQYLTFNIFEEEEGKGYPVWNINCKGGTTANRLQEAMTSTHGMRVFFANGWYDDCTEIGYIYYTLDHANLPKENIYVKPYKSGHMIYISEENCQELSEDIRKFILGEDPSK